MKSNNVILSNYFTTKKDPQRGFKRLPDNDNLVLPWVETLTSLELNGVIFYDFLSDKFIKKFERYNVEFIKYDIITFLSLNDERFICWYDYLLENEWIENVFVTDLFDVEFNKNPFDLITDEFYIYAGTVSEERTVCDSKFWSVPMEKIYGGLFHCDKPLINPGVVGGNRSYMLRLFKGMINDFSIYNNEKGEKEIWEGDVPVFNKNLYDLFDIKNLFLGHPVTSEFKKEQKEGEFYIKHK